MSIYKMSGELILGSRLKRIGDRLLNEVALTYKALGLPFESSWFPVFFLLDQHDTMTVNQIATALEISQPGVSQMVAGLEKKGMLQVAFSETDKRVRTVSLSAAGKELLENVKPVWTAMQSVLKRMLGKSETTAQLLKALDELEEILTVQPVSQNVIKMMESDHE